MLAMSGTGSALVFPVIVEFALVTNYSEPLIWPIRSAASQAGRSPPWRSSPST
jgi:hypothetical protein